MGCVCWLVVCSAPDVGISVFDEVNSDVLCPSVVVDVRWRCSCCRTMLVSSVELLSSVDDSNVDLLVGVITVVNVD